MNGSTNNSYDKTFYTALGRERYKQMAKIELIIDLNRTVTVNFNENRGQLMGTTVRKEVTYNSTYGTLPQAQRNGRGFAGWYTATIEGQEITGPTRVTQLNDHTLYARWTCNVTFNPNGGICSEQSRTVIEGNKYGQLPIPTRTGYTFTGWYTEQREGNQIVAGTIVPDIGNHTLYAHWIPNSYMVMFDANGGTCSPLDKSITYDSQYGELPTPTRTGYTFNGWYTELTGGQKVTATTVVQRTESHTLYAQWTVNTYTVAFNTNATGVSVSPTSKNVTYESTYGELPTPTRAGYTFNGWYTAASGGNKVTSSTKVTSTQNHTLYAQWTVNTYTVTFNTNATGISVSPASKNVTYESTYGELPTPTRTGYTFNGWYTAGSGGNKVTSSTKVTSTQNHTLYAQWTKITYTISYDANGGSGAPSSQTKTYGTDLTLSSTKPTRTGYDFLGWSTSSTATTATYTAGGKYTANSGATLYAVWSINTYTISYDANGGSGAPSSQTKYYGTDLTLSSTKPIRTGYDFLGWSTSSSATTAIYEAGGKYTANSGATLYAVWRQNSFTVSYDANGGSGAPSSQTKYYGTDLTLSTTAPTRTGYTFMGWSTSNSATTATYTAGGKYTANSGATLYAVWTKTTYTIAYNANGGSGAPDSQTKTYGEDLTLSSKAPTRSGHIFLGWGTSSSATTATYQPGGKYTANSGSTLYAVWQQVIEVTSVTLNLTADQWIPYKNNGSAGTLSLTATVAPSNATNKTVTWTSSNTSVATVSNGSVTATGAGFTTITATAGGKSASVKVYVYNAVLNGGTSYWLRYSDGSQASGTLVAGSGGAKLVISHQGGSLWYIHHMTNYSYNSWGTIDHYFSASSTLNKYFTNYGAY